MTMKVNLSAAMLSLLLGSVFLFSETFAAKPGSANINNNGRRSGPLRNASGGALAAGRFQLVVPPHSVARSLLTKQLVLQLHVLGSVEGGKSAGMVETEEGRAQILACHRAHRAVEEVAKTAVMERREQEDQRRVTKLRRSRSIPHHTLTE